MRLEQVLINYLTNAIKYSPDNKNVYVNTTAAEGKLHVAVKDFGIGIPQETRRAYSINFIVPRKLPTAFRV